MIPDETIINTVRITQFASKAGGPNFVDKPDKYKETTEVSSVVLGLDKKFYKSNATAITGHDQI